MPKTGIRLIDIDGAFYLVQAAQITKNADGYGYFLTVTLLNGSKENIGYCGLDDSGLKPVLETITTHVKNTPGRALDLRNHFREGDNKGGDYGCTYARL